MAKHDTRATGSIIDPISETDKQRQVAALCYRKTDDGNEVLLITSRDTKRWILPKGWPIKGKDDLGSALQEAWEEAGVKAGKTGKNAVGTFDYQKKMNNGTEVTCETRVFKVEVRTLANDFPESEERTRKWVPAAKAANMVAEPELRSILAAF
jgi:8-oxo-dGTP pyrophosphatase MutT (NUDIX family)